MVIRELEISDLEALEQLITKVENSLIKNAFWLPINTESRKHFFDKKWTCFYGAFDNDKIIGAVGLFFNQNEYGESQRILNMEDKKIAELGRAMVDPDYRNQKIITHLAEEIMEYASTLNLDAVIATVHPQNVPSQSFLKKLGFEKQASVIKNKKYERDILIKHLTYYV